MIAADFVRASEVWPGDSVEADILFLRPHCHRARLVVGCTFELREGARVVARGVVTERLGIEARVAELLQSRPDAMEDCLPAPGSHH